MKCHIRLSRPKSATKVRQQSVARQNGLQQEAAKATYYLYKTVHKWTQKDT